jgi:small redox-active disulfide protein 2
MKIEVLGPGCSRCHATENNVREALKQLGIEAEVSKVQDIREIMKYGVISTPAVVVNGEVKISGKIPSVGYLKDLFKRHL